MTATLRHPCGFDERHRDRICLAVSPVQNCTGALIGLEIDLLTSAVRIW